MPVISMIKIVKCDTLNVNTNSIWSELHLFQFQLLLSVWMNLCFHP